MEHLGRWTSQFLPLKMLVIYQDDSHEVALI